MPRSSYERLQTVRQALLDIRVDELRRLCYAADLRPMARKMALVDQLTEIMTGESLRNVWEGLTALEKGAVAEVTHSADDQLDLARFEAKYGAVPEAYVRHDPFSYLKPPDSEPRSALPLFLYDRRMPEDLKTELTQFVPKPKAVELATVPELPQTIEIEGMSCWVKSELGMPEDEDLVQPATVHETMRPALHDVHAVLRLIDAKGLTVSEKTRRVSLAGAKAVLEVLHSGDYYPTEDTRSAADTMRPFAWPLLVQAAKLTNKSGTKLKLRPTGRKALSLPAHDVIRAILDEWRESDLLDEFNRIDEIKGQTGRGKRGMSHPAHRRAAILSVLASCPVGQWIAIDELFRYIQAEGDYFHVTVDVWALYIAEAQYGSLGYDGFHDWTLLEGRYCMVFLWEYLATLGLVDVVCVPPEGVRSDYHGNWGADDLLCLSRYDGLLYIRLNELGAYCLGLKDTFHAPPLDVVKAFTVMPNMEIAATDARTANKADLLFLSRFAETVSENVWRLTRKSVLTAAEEGLGTAEITDFLAARSGAALPDNVDRFLQDLGTNAGKLAYRGRCHLIEAADSHLALLIAHDTQLRKLCYVAGERNVVVPERNEKAFRTALKALGYVWPPDRGKGA